MIVTVVLDVTPCSLVEIPNISDSLGDVYEGDCRLGFDTVQSDLNLCYCKVSQCL
jgi:hypothetical protein